jgi:hypothetical protein
VSRVGGRLLPLAVLLAVLLTGCAPQFGQSGSPACEQRGLAGSLPVVLEAQAVPTAALLPCVDLLPAGWSFGSMFVRNGRARFSLANDRVGMPQAVLVVLEPACDTRGAVQVPSDEERTRRYERIESLEGGFKGTRYYVFPGGCVEYRFTFQGKARAAPVNEATLALGFVSRQALQDALDRVYQGRFKLNPPTSH